MRYSPPLFTILRNNGLFDNPLALISRETWEGSICCISVLDGIDLFGAFQRFCQQLTHFNRQRQVRSQDRHLDGLNLSRAWCMFGIASNLPSNDPLQSILLASAKKHADDALAHVASGNYEGEHWLASFAVFMLSQSGVIGK
jgi:hypothetical protein